MPAMLMRYLSPFLSILLLLSPGAMAAQRAFVSGLGSDANPCSITLPCRSFAVALAQTNDAGEIVVLDSAGYGPFTIGQSVKITTPTGVYAGISASGDGITINAPNVRVILRGLSINAAGRGVLIAATATGSDVSMYNLAITGPGAAGIRQEADSRVYIADTSVSSVRDGYTADTTSGTAKMTIERSVAQDCYQGYFAGGNAQLVVSNSSAFGYGTAGASSYAGFIAEGSSVAAGYIACDGCLATNSLFGMVGSPYGGGSASLIRASNSTLFKNNGGVGAYGGSTTVSFGNNRIYDNGPSYGDGGFTTTVTPY